MGIKGLWKEVQPACRAAHVSQFRGQRVGVDTYCWLHRAVIACTLELATGKACDQYLAFIAGRVEMLLRFGVTPVLVFDGDSMPMKRVTDTDRKTRRMQAQSDAQQLLAQGSVEDAVRMFEKSLEISKELAHSAIRVAEDRGIECIVAPYEADAQLAFLAREGYVQAVISEDSDLLVYNCPILLAKMDHNGNCDAIHARDVHHVLGLNGARPMPYESFVMSCIVSGCDYLPSLPGIGVKTAFKIVAAAKSVPDLMNMLATQYGFTARELQPYEETLHQAFYCFAHHLVYDPQQRKIVCFTPLPDKVPHRTELIGPVWDDETADKVCKSIKWDPITLAPYTGKHKESVELYFSKTKRGQQSLTSFSGFEKMKAARVVLSAVKRNSDSSVFGPPPRKMQEASGFIGGGPSQTAAAQRVVLLRSKYFAAPGAGALADLEADGEQSTRSPPEASCAKDDDDNAPSPIADPPAEQISPPAGIVAADLPFRSSCSPPSSSQTESQQIDREVPCPHGYVQCGKVHSVFMRCFEGKSSWTMESRTTTRHVVHHRGDAVEAKASDEAVMTVTVKSTGPFKRPRQMVDQLPEQERSAPTLTVPPPAERLNDAPITRSMPTSILQPPLRPLEHVGASTATSDSTRRAMDLMSSFRLPGGASAVRPVTLQRSTSLVENGSTAQGGGAASAKALFDKLACVPRR